MQSDLVHAVVPLEARQAAMRRCGDSAVAAMSSAGFALWVDSYVVDLCFPDACVFL